MSSTQLPYNPTRLLRSSSYLYIFDSRSNSNQGPQLQTIDLRNPIDTNKLSLQTLASQLNLWITNRSRPYSPLLHPDGNITAVGGVCGGEQKDTQLWRFRPDSKSSSGNGSWTQLPLQEDGNNNDKNMVGYLAEGMVFAPQVNSTRPNILIFGGMCPDQGATSSNWTTAATYSNEMLEVAAQSSDGSSTGPLTIKELPVKGGPIAEAGFTITPLPPSTAAVTGNAVQSLQQNFVLIGGHTGSAFINMSQVAIFSMPHQTWIFQPVQQLQTSRTDLALRDTPAQVEPRSGHTAVMTEDGSKIVVFGGWVGDINTPAQPQLAVLDVGSGYGGSQSWRWNAPSLKGTGLASNAGVYGHGAVMLPGGIMLVHGGYSISASSPRSKRSSSSPQTFLFNTTSNTWISTYSAPANSGSQESSQTSNPSSNSTGRTIGLAVGLSVGFLIFVGLLAFYFWYSRRLKRRRLQSRGLESRSSDGSVPMISQPFLEKHSIDGRGGDMAALNHYWMNAGQPNVQPMAQNSAATGMFVDIPSPTRGLRKGNAARNYQYHPAPRYDDKRLSRGSGSIHPIAELDDEDTNIEGEDADMSEAQRQLKEVERILQGNRKASAAIPDPLRSHPVSPEGAGNKQIEQHSPTANRHSVPKWRADTYVHGENSGRLSPTKTDDRTSSTLSEASQRSIASNSSITRTMSTRTGRMLAAAAAAHVRAKVVEVEASSSSSSSDARTSTMSTDGGQRTPHDIKRSLTNASSVASGARSVVAESFRTARSTAQEGDALLGTAAADYDDPYRRALAADSRAPASSMPPRRRPGLFGSLRRAMGAIATSDRALSLVSSKAGAENGGQSSSSSPVKERRNPIDGLPRRTVSDGGALLRQKRGKHDWADNQWPPYTDDPDLGDWGGPARTSAEEKQAEEDWDVETAVARRDVQVMFTIPKSRLRVVNADADRASLRSVSDGALSRAGSVRVLASKDSRSMLGAVGEEYRSEYSKQA